LADRAGRLVNADAVVVLAGRCTWTRALPACDGCGVAQGLRLTLHAITLVHAEEDPDSPRSCPGRGSSLAGMLRSDRDRCRRDRRVASNCRSRSVAGRRLGCRRVDRRADAGTQGLDLIVRDAHEARMREELAGRGFARTQGGTMAVSSATAASAGSRDRGRLACKSGPLRRSATRADEVARSGRA
jgi:hypothetical protein